MERTYYPIDEEVARSAHNMMSFSDYEVGSLTEEYRAYCDKAYKLADKIAEKHPEDSERAYRLAERYAKKMADNLNQRSRIGTMCPSIMISGAGNFPVRKKEKQNRAADRNYQEWNGIQDIILKLEKMLSGQRVIKSSDPNAIGKLEKKLVSLKEMQESMKAANRAIRLKDTEKGDEKLREMGFSDSQIEELREPDFCGSVGYPNYMLQNNNANIHRIEGRIKELEEAKTTEPSETEHDGFRVVENTDIMRLQILFDGKPDADVRAVLKKNGFHWAPSQGAWQRQLTQNARYSLERVLKEIENAV